MGVEARRRHIVPELAMTATGAASGGGVLRATISVTVFLTIALATVAIGELAAQSALAQLGLTETAARNFVLDEIRRPAQDRRAAIVLAGTRAFLRLPASARAAAATALFAWAKAYVNSPAFKASYDTHRKNRIPPTRQSSLTVDETLKKQLDEERAAFEEMKKNLAASGLPPAEQEKVLAAWKEAAAKAAEPAFVEMRRKALEAERDQALGGDARLREEVEQQTPADPRQLFARRLREFLELTADVNFSARTISLTGGPDNVEFIDAADRERHWMWQAAAIVGPDATAAARAAAQAWLKEIER
jgi:hypothetical protein